MERRCHVRVAPEVAAWLPAAVLRPGQIVAVKNVSRGGALLESAGRLRPGARTELQFVCGLRRRSVRGRLERCEVAGLEPLRYRGVVVFETTEAWATDGGCGEG